MKWNTAWGFALSLFCLVSTGCAGGKDVDDTGSSANDRDGDGFSVDQGDCDDDDASISPEAAELCDAVDNNCDGVVDEEGAQDATTWYRDADGDGYGNGENIRVLCEQPTGYIADGSDCDDLDAAVNADGVESCNGVDDDCDGVVDGETALGATSWYADADGDGFGDASRSVFACQAPSAYVADGSDSDDTDSSTN